jgi:phosphoribosyl-AMP cyclohydrolase
MADRTSTTTPVPDFAKRGGLVTAIAQDHATGEILMVAYMNEEAYLKTLELGEVVYWSTSRDELWHKGESSGNTQTLKELYVDCDADVVLVKVDQKGDAACHTGRRSCFYRLRAGDDWKDVGVQVFDPDEVYGKK